jgi:adenylate kinase
MGVAGAGKSVQGKLLADDLGYIWLSTGEFLRMHISGERRKEMLAGKLLDDEEIISILDKFLIDTGHDEACVLDGFPRTVVQAKWLLNQHMQGDVKLRAIVHLVASKETVMQRLLSRGRQDDTQQAINQRFAEYERETLPIVELFNEANISVIEIDGERSIDDIHQDIMTRIQTGHADKD